MRLNLLYKCVSPFHESLWAWHEHSSGQISQQLLDTTDVCSTFWSLIDIRGGIPGKLHSVPLRTRPMLFAMNTRTCYCAEAYADGNTSYYRMRPEPARHRRTLRLNR